MTSIVFMFSCHLLSAVLDRPLDEFTVSLLKSAGSEAVEQLVQSLLNALDDVVVGKSVSASSVSSRAVLKPNRLSTAKYPKELDGLSTKISFRCDIEMLTPL